MHRRTVVRFSDRSWHAPRDRVAHPFATSASAPDLYAGEETVGLTRKAKKLAGSNIPLQRAATIGLVFFSSQFLLNWASSTRRTLALTPIFANSPATASVVVVLSLALASMVTSKPLGYPASVSKGFRLFEIVGIRFQVRIIAQRKGSNGRSKPACISLQHIINDALNVDAIIQRLPHTLVRQRGVRNIRHEKDEGFLRHIDINHLDTGICSRFGLVRRNILHQVNAARFQLARAASRLRESGEI